MKKHMIFAVMLASTMIDANSTLIRAGVRGLSALRVPRPAPTPEEIRAQDIAKLKDMSWMFDNLYVPSYSQTVKFNAQCEVVGHSLAFAAVGAYVASYLPCNFYLAGAALGLGAVLYGKKGFEAIKQTEQAHNAPVKEFEYRKFIWNECFKKPLQNEKIFSDDSIAAWKRYADQDDRWMTDLAKKKRLNLNIIGTPPHEGAHPRIVELHQQRPFRLNMRNV